MNRVQFIVAEPSYIVRKGLVSLINEQPNAMVVREVEDANRLAELVTHYSASVVVINMHLLKTVPSEIVTKLVKRKNGICIIALQNCVTDSIDSIGNMVSQSIAIDEPKPMVQKKMKQIISQSLNRVESQTDSTELSDREIEILKDVALGLSNKEIAEKNFISPHTVIAHRKNITRKLGIKTVAGLTIYAIINKLLGVEDVG